MNDISKAISLIEQTERDLRSLMERALGDQRYADVASVAPLAEAIANLLRAGLEVPAIVPTARQGLPDHSLSTSPKSRDTGKAARGDKYPYFKKDGEKLVKVGWSKKDRREYEHRAPREAIFRMAAALKEAVPGGSVFSMETMLPLRGDDGNDLPSYQAYLALAWFRSIGIVEARGKEGYVFATGAVDRTNIQRLWKEIKAK